MKRYIYLQKGINHWFEYILVTIFDWSVCLKEKYEGVSNGIK